jgi:predicted transcriptional regulator
MPRTSEETDLDLYDMICTHPGLSTYDYAKLKGWNYGKVQKAIDRLEDIGFITSEKVVDSRLRRVIKPVDWKKLYKTMTESEAPTHEIIA